MNINRMRKIDYYVGVPLCFVLSWVLKAIRLIAKNAVKPQPQNVLLIELSEMGSAIIVDPILERLKDRQAKLFFVIFHKNRKSLDLLKTIDSTNVFTLREDNLLTLSLDTLRFFIWCRKHSIDTVIDLELFSRFTALLSGLCGAATRVGFYKFTNEGLYRGEIFNKRVAYNPHIHIVQNFYSLIHALYDNDNHWPPAKIVTSKDDFPLKKIDVEETQLQSVLARIHSLVPDATPGKIVLINPNAGDLLPQRRWPAVNFVELIKMILDKHSDVTLLLTGSPAERADIGRIHKNVADSRCVNFAGCVEFSELPALYSVSACMITNDSGPAHFASVTDIHTIVLFGPETPTLYSSLGKTTPVFAGLNCSPCVSAWNHRNSPCGDNLCMKAISPEMVYHCVVQVIP